MADGWSIGRSRVELRLGFPRRRMVVVGADRQVHLDQPLGRDGSVLPVSERELVLQRGEQGAWELLDGASSQRLPRTQAPVTPTACPPEARCARHDVLASIACARCGTFCCDACGSPDLLHCTACAALLLAQGDRVAMVHRVQADVSVLSVFISSFLGRRLLLVSLLLVLVLGRVVGVVARAAPDEASAVRRARLLYLAGVVLSGVVFWWRDGAA